MFDSSTPGTTIEELIDQLVIPDNEQPGDRVVRINTFLLIYRKFMRPRELLKIFIDRFEELGDYTGEDEEDENLLEANSTRHRICYCLYIWLTNHPNDLIHRQTRQIMAWFLRERVALFPCLNQIYSKLVPLSSIQYFYAWRWPHQYNQQLTSAAAAIAGSAGRSGGPRDSIVSARMSWASSSSYASEDDTDSGYHDISNGGSINEGDMDEDRDWGFADEDIVIAQTPTTPAATTIDGNNTNSNSNNRDSQLLLTPLDHRAAPHAHAKSSFLGGSTSPQFPQLHSLTPRDRRSSTGSFISPLNSFPSPCEMETFVAGRRGSASSVTSGNAAAAAAASSTGPLSPEDQMPFLLHQHQPMSPIPIISKRSSSQAYRHQRSLLSQQQNVISSSSTTDSSTFDSSSVESTSSSGTTTSENHKLNPSLIVVGDGNVMGEERIHPLSVPNQQEQPQAQPQPLAQSKPQPPLPKQRQLDPDESKLISTIVQQSIMVPVGNKGPYSSVKAPARSPKQQPVVTSTTTKVLIDPLHVLHPHLLTYISFMDLKDSAIAEQLTLMEAQLFQELQPRDMLRQVWKGKRTNGPLPAGSGSGSVTSGTGSTAFLACIAHVNFITCWAATMILLPSKAKNRAKMIEKFISIGRILKEMRNYSTLMAIVGAVNATAIHRLHQTRNLVGNGGRGSNGESWKVFQELEHLMSSGSSYAEYRATLKAAAMDISDKSSPSMSFSSLMSPMSPGSPMPCSSSPTLPPSSSSPSYLSCIPYLGVHLADLLSISEGNKDSRQDGTLHWQKFVLLTDTIATVMQFLPEKPSPYQESQSNTHQPQQQRSRLSGEKRGYSRIQIDPFIARFITDIRVMDADEQWARSIELEPQTGHGGGSSLTVNSSSSNPFSSFSAAFNYHQSGSGASIASSGSSIYSSSSTSSRLNHSRSLSKFTFFG
ncbi:hypothetical protein BGZ83_011676 [Gryganskiella cystojenkinii]|nr:hypothetical protein BGZ83_011676 [Gryganskiella cystojenkinii]